MEKRSSRRGLLYTYKDIWKNDKATIMEIVINAIASGIAPFVWIVTPKLMIDELQGDQNVMRFVMILGIAFLIAALTSYTKSYLVGSFRMKMSRVRLRLGLLVHERAMMMDFDKTESKDHQNLLKQAKKATSSPQTGFGVILNASFLLAAYAVSFIGFTSILMSLHYLIFLFIVVNVIIVHVLSERSFKYAQSRRVELSEVERKSIYIAGTMSDFSFGKDIRIYQLKELLLGKKKEFDHERIDIRKAMEKKNLKRDIADALLNFLRDGIVYAYIAYLVIRGDISVGSFMMYALSIASFANVLKEMLMEVSKMKDACVAVDDFLDFIEEKDDCKELEKDQYPREHQVSIEFKNVSFRYPGSEKKIFDGINLRINPGEKLAVVGVNGAGKTTLVKLLTHLYQPDDGDIYLGGVAMSQMNRDKVYDYFSVVFQEIRPLAISLKENIALGNNDDEGVNAVLSQAGVKDKIDSLDKGIETSLLKFIDPEGLELSGGENQKIALARALYKDAPIVVLDEPTAALDPLAEKEIYESFNTMIHDRTAIFISHRLSSTKFCDRIAFFENGKIVEYGTHDELMALSGKYKEMFSIQAQYYQDVAQKGVV